MSANSSCSHSCTHTYSHLRSCSLTDMVRVCARIPRALSGVLGLKQGSAGAAPAALPLFVLARTQWCPAHCFSAQVAGPPHTAAAPCCSCSMQCCHCHCVRGHRMEKHPSLHHKALWLQRTACAQGRAPSRYGPRPQARNIHHTSITHPQVAARSPVPPPNNMQTHIQTLSSPSSSSPVSRSPSRTCGPPHPAPGTWCAPCCMPSCG